MVLSYFFWLLNHLAQQPATNKIKLKAPSDSYYLPTLLATFLLSVSCMYFLTTPTDVLWSINLTSIYVGLVFFAACSLHLVSAIMIASYSPTLYVYVEIEMGFEMVSSAALCRVIIFHFLKINNYPQSHFFLMSVNWIKYNLPDLMACNIPILVFSY